MAPCSKERYHKSLNNVTPADVYHGGTYEVLAKRERTTKHTMREHRRLYEEAISAGL